MSLAFTSHLRVRAPRAYARSRKVVRHTRRWFAESSGADGWASVAPALMLGRNLERSPRDLTGNETSRRLNRLAAGLPSRSTYLEVGVARGETFEAVDVPFKWGVDPVPNFNTHLLPQGCRFTCLPSDDYFSQLDPAVGFDLVFIDGLHEWHQAYADLLNSLAHSHPHTIILLDDVVPADEFASWPDMDSALVARHKAGNMSTGWQGDVYKVLFAIRDFHPELEFRVIIDGFNAQAVIWQKDGAGKSCQKAMAPDQYIEQTFPRVFVDGQAPEWFGCLSEDEAIATAHRATQTRR